VHGCPFRFRVTNFGPPEHKAVHRLNIDFPYIHSFTGAYSPGRIFGLPLRGFFITHIQTHGRTPLDEWSARRRGLYLHRTTQHINTTDIHASRGFEPATPATKRPQTCVLDRAATGIGIFPTLSRAFSSWSTVTDQVTKKFHALDETRSFITVFTRPDTGPCPEPDKSNWHLSDFLKMHFNIILLPYAHGSFTLVLISHVDWAHLNTFLTSESKCLFLIFSCFPVPRFHLEKHRFINKRSLLHYTWYVTCLKY
jgi:hypothetical protein